MTSRICFSSSVLVIIMLVTINFATISIANAQTRTGALTLPTGENKLYSAVIDSAGGYAYFGTFTFPGRVVKVRLSDFTRVDALTLQTGENKLASAVIDSAGGYAYFGTITSPGIVVKIGIESAPTPTPTPTPDTPEYEYPVGGYLAPINKLEILTPYLALAGLIIAVSTVYIIKKRKD